MRRFQLGNHFAERLKGLSIQQHVYRLHKPIAIIIGELDLKMQTVIYIKLICKKCSPSTKRRGGCYSA
jgi:hypothetical protein